MEKPYRRKTYYIKNSAQTKFILRFVSISLLGGIAAVSAFNFLAYKKIDSVLYSMRMPKISPGGLLWNEMIYSNIFVIIFIMLIFALTARGLYNRVHGPLKKLTSDFDRMAAGDLSREIALRENDEFQEFAGNVNEMAGELNARFSEGMAACDEIIAGADNLAASGDNREAVTALHEAIARLEKSIGSFKV